jgi:hypothetical protein
MEHEDAREGLKMHTILLIGKPERNRPFGRPRRRWEDNIRMDIKEISRSQ